MEVKDYLPKSVTDQLPTMVRVELVKMLAEKQAEFLEEFKRKKKSTAVGYILWFLLGWHYAYFGKWGWQVLFWITIGGVCIWWIVDAFRIPSIKRNYNRDVGIDVLRNMKAISG